MDISFEAIDVPGSEEIVQARLMKWAQDVLDQKAFHKVPFDLMMQMNLLFEETPKDELIARLVARELSRLNVNSGRDINQRAQQDGDRSPQRRRSSSGGYSRSGSGGFSKPRGNYKKSGGASSDSGNGRKKRNSSTSAGGGKKYGGFGKSGRTQDSGGGFKKKHGGKRKRSGFGSKPFKG